MPLSTQSSVMYGPNCKYPCEPDNHMSQIHNPIIISAIDDISLMIEINYLPPAESPSSAFRCVNLIQFRTWQLDYLAKDL
jgi:hypothetical protein